MRTPNPEQKKAIEHDGGVLLSAGAGSGKTFVLVEHILFLIKKHLELNKKSNIDETMIDLKSYLSKIVLMTFTNKAAGELQLRLEQRIGQDVDWEKYNLSSDHIRDSITSMFVGTIDGFCFRLIKMGFFPEIDPSIEIISSTESTERIEKLFKDWVLDNWSENSDLFKTIVKLERDFISSMKTVFEDPGLRSAWKNYQPSDEIDLDSFFKEYLEVTDLIGLFSDRINLADYSSFATKKWYEILNDFYKSFPTWEISSIDDLERYDKYFKNIKQIRGPKDPDERLKDQLRLLKEFKTFINKNLDSLRSSVGEFKGRFIAWNSMIKSIFDYIDERYVEFSGITFADLEYNVLRGLDDINSLRRIQDQFSYFIVDEFQDTSYVQFDILDKLINNQLDKVFCVGDVKQAIYGFRGGELQVFKNCQDNIPLNLSMKNNYRSHSKIIHFNNYLFQNLFKKGRGFEGEDRFTVEVSFQESPREEEGCLKELLVSLDTGGEKIKKPSSREIDQIESVFLLKQIQKIRSEFEDDTVCLLYSKLGPSNHLIPQLIANEVGFVCQVKVELREDPLVSFFALLIELLITYKKESESKYSLFKKNTIWLIEKYLKILNFNFCLKEVEEELDIFVSSAGEWGVFPAFQKFIFNLGIKNSNYKNNLEFLSALVKSTSGDIESIWKKIKSEGSGKYSIDFYFGNNPKKLQIMTAHASKGLEFDHVFICGIHTNGRTNSDAPYIGSIPGSFKWKIDSKVKETLNSPMYILEKAISSKKEFSESKRLFYVACTRAVKSLSWVSLSFNGEQLKFSEDSWIVGLRKFLDEESISASHSKIPEISREVFEAEYDGTLDSIVKPTTKKIEDSQVPLFHTDNLGIYESYGNSFRLLISPELSVTRLAMILDCPRKFYLKNILKLDAKSITDTDNDISITIDDFKISEEENINDQIDEIVNVKSSAERGTLLHAHISNMINRNWVVPLSVKEPKDQRALEWIKARLLDFNKDFDYVSEIPLKFRFFGHMISGTPDLILYSKDNKSVEIWDFKTGKPNNEKELSYWFQLMTYSYALYNLGKVKQNSSIILKLAYIDTQQFKEKTIDFNVVQKSLYNEWRKVNNSNLTNKDHCSKCEFGNICHPF